MPSPAAMMVRTHAPIRGRGGATLNLCDIDDLHGFEPLDHRTSNESAVGFSKSPVSREPNSATSFQEWFPGGSTTSNRTRRASHVAALRGVTRYSRAWIAQDGALVHWPD